MTNLLARSRLMACNDAECGGYRSEAVILLWRMQAQGIEEEVPDYSSAGKVRFPLAGCLRSSGHRGCWFKFPLQSAGDPEERERD